MKKAIKGIIKINIKVKIGSSEILNIEDSLDINEEDLNLKNTYKECNKNDLDIDSIKENQKIKNIQLHLLVSLYFVLYKLLLL